MEYFNYYKSKYHVDHANKSSDPVLTDEDEAFLQRVASEGTPPPLPERRRPQHLPEAGSTSGNDAQIVLMHGAQDIPLPDIPDTPDEVSRELGEEDSGKGKGKEKEKDKGKGKEQDGKGRKVWSFLRRDSRDAKRKHQAAAGADLHSVAEGLKAADAVPNEDGVVSDPEVKKEEEEMTVVLEQLSLAAVNNRVFSISKESQELLRKYVSSIYHPRSPLLSTTTPLTAIHILTRRRPPPQQIHTCPQRPHHRCPHRLLRSRIPPHALRHAPPKSLRLPPLLPAETHRIPPLQTHRLPRARDPRRSRRKTGFKIRTPDASGGDSGENGGEG